MRPLPLSLWALVAAQIEAREQQEQQQKQQAETSPLLLLPTAIRKMPADSGAKFHPHYYAFAAAPAPPPEQPALVVVVAREATDNSSSSTFHPPFAILNTSPNPSSLELLRRAALQKRQWSCPSGTTSCASIGYPNSCCQASESCVAVKDTGLGPVGCCPAGATCNGSVGSCADGSSPCGSSIGGGCCIPGFVCAGVGCIKRPPPSSSTTLIAQPTTPTSTPTQTSITPTPSSPSPSSPSTSPTTPTATLTSSSPPSSVQDPNAPMRPTTSPASTTDEAFCPTGFYACSASAGGGCCQTGRDCRVTSCPPVSMTTIVNDDGITVVVPATGRSAPPVDGGAKKPQGCASGWFECGKEDQGGCCPSGYRCGVASCAVDLEGGAAGETAVAKVLPGESSAARGCGGGQMGWWWWCAALVSLFGAVVMV